MFTGIVEELGSIVAIEVLGDSARLVVSGPLVTSDAGRGDSIAVNGCCLTVIEQGAGTFTADVMLETLSRTNLGELAPGQPVNLERAARVGDRLGGHIVQGHVDATAAIVAREPGERWEVVRFALPPDAAQYVVTKGSIAVDGVSLTVVEAADDSFTVSLIPETLEVTTLGAKRVGELVNIEFDIIGKYVERLVQVRAAKSEGSTQESV
ncbi:MAG: riboflavin synthase [Mycobacteriales bacterium]